MATDTPLSETTMVRTREALVVRGITSVMVPLSGSAAGSRFQTRGVSGTFSVSVGVGPPFFLRLERLVAIWAAPLCLAGPAWLRGDLFGREASLHLEAEMRPAVRAWRLY